jgi:high-affinity nickel-transport protein
VPSRTPFGGYYDITVTGLSVTVALVVGSIELLQVLTGRLNALDFQRLGYGIVALFVLPWIGAVAIWKRRRIEERWRAVIDS